MNKAWATVFGHRWNFRSARADIAIIFYEEITRANPKQIDISNRNGNTHGVIRIGREANGKGGRNPVLLANMGLVNRRTGREAERSLVGRVGYGVNGWAMY